MLRLLKREAFIYFANMGQTFIYNHLTNQLTNGICHKGIVNTFTG